MHNAQVAVLGFAAFSGTGKTTLLEQLIPLLKKNNLRVALIKHSHHNFDIDKPGKDSYRLREAGATPVMLVSKYRRAIITEFETEEAPRLDDQLRSLDQTNLDLSFLQRTRTRATRFIFASTVATDNPRFIHGLAKLPLYVVGNRRFVSTK